jgi:predicted transcriptional regulator
MYRGYITVWRKIQDSFFYKDSEYVHLWVHLLIKACSQDQSFMFAGKRQSLKRGQLLTGLKKLSYETGIEWHKCERILKCLKNENLIEKQNYSKFSVITILNYDEHNEKQSEKRMRSKREADENIQRSYKQLKANKERINKIKRY